MTKKISIGVDVGGSHVSCMAYDLESKQLLEHTHAENDLDNHGQPAEIIEAWGKTIKKTMELAGVENVQGVGFAMPGPFDYVKGIPLFTGENGKYENINGIDVPAELRNYLGLSANFKIRFINDATAFAIGEDQVGKAKDFGNSLSVTLGTGFGSAFIKNGLPIVEGAEVPENGCLWHLPFEDGIADDYFSTRGLINRYEKATGEKLPGVKQIAELAAENQLARELFNDFGTKMGSFLKPWIENFGIEIFVMGGNISRAYHLFGTSLNIYLEQAGLNMKVAISELKETASFIGAATLVDDQFYQKVLPALAKM
ncbi:ROK family protein [Maribellus sp. YY47]|uniref:ROK family protein n=1 Tax=Maribellus sp. YY47 TaxID=2929486 RepID=UPI002000C8A8|nr:ROK family protein [Maribellus sp. YY47]MCK3683609.1 ROK family protein [Maribellus sp. YY47]